MELKNQVVSLELAKKLKELGVKQESLYVWHRDAPRYGWLLCVNDDKRYPMGTDRISAFTVAELGEMLPMYVEWEGKNIYLDIGDTLKKLCYIDYADERYRIRANADTEADARAKMLIYLLENKLLSI